MIVHIRQNHQTLYLKLVNFIVHELYLNTISLKAL